MPTIAEALNVALQHHQAGRLPEAEALYRQVLQAQPNHPDALHQLGMIAYEVGRYDAAVDFISRAIRVQPARADYFNNLGEVYRRAGKLDDALAAFQRALALSPGLLQAMTNIGGVLRQQGKLDEAAAHYRQMLRRHPEFADLNNNLGNVLQQQGNFEEAVAQYRRAATLKPDCAEVHNNMGAAYYAQGKLEEAAGHYRRALAIKPDYAEALMWLGKAQQEQGKPEEAVACYQRALALTPNNVDVFNNLGVALWNLGRQEDAIACLRQALTLRPDFAEAHSNLGNVLRDQGGLEEAARHYRQALMLKPDFAGAYNNLGNALLDQGRREEAVQHYQRALTLQPDFAEPYYNLGHVLRDHGRLEEAARHYNQALVLDPTHVEAENQLMHALQYFCDWNQVEALVERQKRHLRTRSDSAVPPFTFLCIPTSPAEQLLCAQRWAAKRLAPIARLRESLGFRFARASKPKLRVGYLSQDFRNHPVAWLIAELFELHDRKAVEVYAYSYGPDDGSESRKRLVSASDRFTDIRALSFVEAARRIHEDEIDILIDLQGYTGPARTEIVALRPAPVQVNYLGYPGTMGAEFIDYILTNRFFTPPEQEPYYAEKFVYLPVWCDFYDHKRVISKKTPSRRELGLPETGFVFCCFSNTYKITRPIFGVWMRLLKKLPGSVLWLLEANGRVVANLREEAKKSGIDPRRLVFAPRVPRAQYLARFRRADLFLDTLPYNAHSTAFDALWVGLPVLSCVGETFPSRVGGGLLTALGMPELVAHSLKEYEARAARLARYPAELARLRRRLAKNRTTAPLFDSELCARHLERAYRLMWERYLAGEAPGMIDVPEKGKKEGRRAVAKNRIS